MMRLLAKDHYAVIGNPIAHSLSPQIHTQFAKQTGQDMIYTAQLCEIGAFNACIAELQQSGFKGVNVTLPFKEQAYQLADQHTLHAKQAQAANTLVFQPDGTILADNTDGIGLIRDLTQNLHYSLKNRSILLIGAGGAARNIIPSLLEAAPLKLTIVNRTIERAYELAALFAHFSLVAVNHWEQIDEFPYDLIINTTSIGLTEREFTYQNCTAHPHTGYYDLSYGKSARPFLDWSKARHAAWSCDGWGMLLEQAAEAFFIWRGIRPETRSLLKTRIL